MPRHIRLLPLSSARSGQLVVYYRANNLVPLDSRC